MERNLRDLVVEDKEIKYSALDLIEFGLVFVEGAIYKDRNGTLFQSVYTGKFWTGDCYELDSELQPIHSYSYPVHEDDLIEFIGFAP